PDILFAVLACLLPERWYDICLFAGKILQFRALLCRLGQDGFDRREQPARLLIRRIVLHRRLDRVRLSRLSLLGLWLSRRVGGWRLGKRVGGKGGHREQGEGCAETMARSLRHGRMLLNGESPEVSTLRHASSILHERRSEVM